MPSHRTKQCVRVEPADPESLQRGVRQLLADTNAIAWALLTQRPDLPGWKQVSDWLTGELARYT